MVDWVYEPYYSLKITPHRGAYISSPYLSIFVAISKTPWFVCIYIHMDLGCLMLIPMDLKPPSMWNLFYPTWKRNYD